MYFTSAPHGCAPQRRSHPQVEALAAFSTSPTASAEKDGTASNLGRLLLEAVTDLYRLNPHDATDPRARFERFIGWASPGHPS
jgi:hypothetical protein